MAKKRQQRRRRAKASDVVLTAQETADILRIGLNQVYDGIRSGDIPAFRVNKRIIIPRVGIEKKLAGAGA